MRILMAALIACISLPIAAHAAAKGPDPQEEAARLARSQFEPLSQVASAKRTLRRVSYQQSFDFAIRPAVTIEKMANGEVMLTLTAREGKVHETAKLTQADWDKLMAADKLIMAKPARKLSREEAKLICHSNAAVIEASDAGKVRRRDASHCNQDLDSMVYGFKVAEIAVANIPRCTRYQHDEREASWQLMQCIIGNNVNQAGMGTGITVGGKAAR